jgi:hypothetical protein
MTALALAPDARIGHEPAASAGIDRAIRMSTAIAVLAVAGVAAYVSYWHAYAVVCAHGESGITARLEPATIDGLVYASSMVNLYAARHRLPVPALARWLLALGIVATLAANMAQGWSHGPVGAVIAAWPAVSLVGSYELLVWIIRTAAAGDRGRMPVVDQRVSSATTLRPAAPLVREAGPVAGSGHGTSPAPAGAHGPLPVARSVAWVRGPGQESDHVDQADQAGGAVRHAPDQVDPVDRIGVLGPSNAAGPVSNIDAAAVAAYRVSLREGRPLSERKLAEAFGKTSRRWARNRMAEARQNLVPT